MKKPKQRKPKKTKTRAEFVIALETLPTRRMFKLEAKLAELIAPIKGSLLGDVGSSLAAGALLHLVAAELPKLKPEERSDDDTCSAEEIRALANRQLTRASMDMAAELAASTRSKLENVPKSPPPEGGTK